ncbi:MAG: hypothetical protein HOU81_23025 [Hamadaea sp.]|uniref:hypothetical protein n=1 Tax=Hamadaea sp. TaxID=2024425 RepID=UPI0017E730DA|nr:hypothetical protein [Hamadaea sp.]NUR73698.1 hypothetical protein [Hamadaea sp.]NUT22549.1 hypothetical protein [Hamadaea sp.]
MSLEHVYWIGGGSGGGKSTVARRLAADHGLRLYATDDVMADHASRTTAAESPYLAQFQAMDLDQRWLTRSPETMLATFHWYRGEAFGLIEDDLRAEAGKVVAEGFRLLPHLVRPLLPDVRRAVWLLPTPGFRRSALEQRGSLWSIASRTSDPPRALENLLARDAMFTERVRAEATGLGLRVIEVDGTATQNELVAEVASWFGFAGGDRADVDWAV